MLSPKFDLNHQDMILTNIPTGIILTNTISTFNFVFYSSINCKYLVKEEPEGRLPANV